MTTNEQQLLKERRYQNLADCIRSDQLSAKQVIQEMEQDLEFKDWYSKKYLTFNL